MIGICLESSHKRGMGHLFRVFNLTKFLNNQNHNFILFINNDKNAISLIKEKNINYEVVNLADFQTDWESELINKYKIKTWINDRLDTDIRHSKNIIKNNVKLVTFDDAGSGAELADINIAALSFNCSKNLLKGKKILTDIKYLILNKEIEKYKRIRTQCDKILVTHGGSDTYGVSIKTVKILKEINKPATIITGPSFHHKKELESIIDQRFTIKNTVPSLIEEFYNYDLAITGGGITPFEANASGLPCIIIANEPHEIQSAQYLEQIGSSVFAGYHDNINIKLFNQILNIKKMSKNGCDAIKTSGVDNIFSELYN
jgi:spore coat polysaccharide biosynthesis predicted glycosyltransferase SpsG